MISLYSLAQNLREVGNGNKFFLWKARYFDVQNTIVEFLNDYE